MSDDLHKYDAVPADKDAAKAHHLSVLKDDANILDSYFREGEPLRLSLGLYPGERLRQPVWRVIRDYRPPEKKRDVADALPVQSVRLDSMALFDVGQARLKDGSTKVLINALVNIRARPGWLIVVTGYTDTTGNKKANQQLSLRRAEAVRDWMLQTSDIPATCFAVQGLGESHPAATNDTPEGRAAIWFRFSTDARLKIGVIEFYDDQSGYERGLTLPLRHPSGMSDSGTEAVWGLNTAYSVVSRSVTTRDYNYREAMAEMTTGQFDVTGGDNTTYGEAYHYADNFLKTGDKATPESGAFYARIRHERYLNGRAILKGQSTSSLLMPGLEIKVEGNDAPEVFRKGILIFMV